MFMNSTQIYLIYISSKLQPRNFYLKKIDDVYAGGSDIVG